MRVGVYDLKLWAKKTNKPLSESVIGDETIVGAEPKTVFSIVVEVHPDDNGTFPGNMLLAEVFVDGIFVISRWLDTTGKKAPVLSYINGYRASDQHIARFDMVKPNKMKDAGPGNCELGTVKVAFFIGERVICCAEKRIPSAKTPEPNKYVDSEAKFWQRASLITKRGRVKFKPLPHAPGTMFDTVQKGSLLATLGLRYHTNKTLAKLQEIAKDRAQNYTNETIAKLPKRAEDTAKNHAPFSKPVYVDLTLEKDRDADAQKAPQQGPSVPVLCGMKRAREPFTEDPPYRSKFA